MPSAHRSIRGVPFSALNSLSFLSAWFLFAVNFNFLPWIWIVFVNKSDEASKTIHTWRRCWLKNITGTLPRAFGVLFWLFWNTKPFLALSLKIHTFFYASQVCGQRSFCLPIVRVSHPLCPSFSSFRVRQVSEVICFLWCRAQEEKLSMAFGIVFALQTDKR